MEYILETENLTKTYGKKTALNNVSIHVNQGDIYGLVGRNGAGKTTLMKIVCGLSRKSNGGFSIFGRKDTCELKTDIIFRGADMSNSLKVFRFVFSYPQE